MKKYVMFGHNNLFGDLVEIIHANQGILTKIVQNIPEPYFPNRPPLQERLATLQDAERNPHNINQSYPIEVLPLENFSPEPNEVYLIGFTGFRMNELRQELQRKFQIHFAPLIHPSALISPTAKISSGVIINMGSIIASGVVLGDHVAINKGVIIGHDTHLEDYVVAQPGVKVAGHVRVGKGAVLGIGSTIIEDLKIGEYSLIAAGAVVIKDVPPHTLVAGVPAIPKKLLHDSR